MEQIFNIEPDSKIQNSDSEARIEADNSGMELWFHQENCFKYRLRNHLKAKYSSKEEQEVPDEAVD